MRLIPAQFGKPYRKSTKNDFIDGERIAETTTKQNMRFVQIKTQEQLDVQTMHQVQDRLVQRRRALINDPWLFVGVRNHLPGTAHSPAQEPPSMLEDDQQKLEPTSVLATGSAVPSGSKPRSTSSHHGRDRAR